LPLTYLDCNDSDNDEIGYEEDSSGSEERDLACYFEVDEHGAVGW